MPKPQIIRKNKVQEVDKGILVVRPYQIEGYDEIGVAHVTKKSDVSDFYPDNDLLDYVLKGSGTVTLNGEVYTVQEGDLVFIPRGTKFKWSGGVELLAIVTPQLD